jgi:hypothetical protein
MDIAFGSLGLISLISTVESCARGYDRFIASAHEVPAKSNKFAIHIRIEQRKFQLYWDYMGLSHKNCPLLEEQSRKTQDLIVDVACEVKALLSDAKILADRYGFESVPANANETEEIAMGDFSAESNLSPATVLNRVFQANNQEFLGRRRNLSRRQTLIWKWKDEQKAMSLLKDLRDFNEQLWTSLAPHHEILLKQGEPAWILPGLNDPWAIQLLAEAETSEIDRPLTVCSSLRTACLQVDATDDIPFHEAKPTGLRRKNGFNNIGPNRYLECLNGRDVIVEYKTIDVNMSNEDRSVCRDRLRSLMKLFARKNHPMIRILHGLALFTDGPHRAEFGLVFDCPRPILGRPVDYITLDYLLATRDNNTVQPLGRRFKLAQALAKSLMFLHASGWYHKNLRPDGIIFQNIGNSGVDITEPRIMGFDYSRPNRESEPSLDNRGHADLDLYAHPDRQLINPPRFRAIHDYYSLAMCLIAIGWWRPINSVEKRFRKEFGSNGTSLQWQTYMLTEVSSSLKALCGEIYADVASVCLSGDFSTTAWSQGDGQEWGSQKAFFTQVVSKLHKCCA